MAELDEERKKLGDLLKELLTLMGNIEDMEKCLTAIKKKAVGIYKEIDAKLNGD